MELERNTVEKRKEINIINIMDISKNNQIDLLYLTNPNFKIKYNKKRKYKLVSLDDIKFYRKRILIDTKEYLRGNK